MSSGHQVAKWKRLCVCLNNIYHGFHEDTVGQIYNTNTNNEYEYEYEQRTDIYAGAAAP